VYFVRDHLAERRATFGEHDLIAEALNRGMGKVSLPELEAAIQADPELVSIDQQKNAMRVLTDRTNLGQEKESVAFVNAGVGTAKPITESFVPFPELVHTVDEWGLLSNRSGHALLRIAKEHGALVRFVGDTRQHVAVEAGDFGRTLEQHSNLRSVSLSKISRQRDPEYRAAVMEMASSKITEGLARLDQKG
jgi:AAA domain